MKKKEIFEWFYDYRGELILMSICIIIGFFVIIVNLL